MGSAISLSVVCDSPVNRGGQIMNGKVYLRVLQADKVHANELKVRFYGSEKVKIKVETGSGKSKRVHTYSENHTIFSTECTLCRFDVSTVLSKGDYIFPFSFNLPIGLPAGFSFNVPKGKCSLRYTAQASLVKPGTLFGTSEYKSSELDVIVDGSHIPVSPSPEMLVPRGDRINQCCCFDKGTLHSGAMIDKCTVSNGETMTVKVAFENHSTSRMKAVEVTLYEDINCNARGHSSGKRMSKFYMRIPPEQLGSMWLPLAEVGVRSDKVDAEILQKLTVALKQVNEQGVVRIPIQTCTNDYYGQHISVRHSLIIRIATPFCITDPEHEAQVHVQSAAPGAHSMNTYEIACAPPSAPPADWAPKTMDSLPMAEAQYVVEYPVASAPPIAHGQVVLIDNQKEDISMLQELYTLLDKSFPMSAAGNVMEFFAIHDSITTVGPAALGTLLQHIREPTMQIRVSEFLSTRIQGISVQHLLVVCKSIVPQTQADAATTGTRWQVLRPLAKVCVDPQNYQQLASPLSSFGNIPLPIIQSLFTGGI